MAPHRIHTFKVYNLGAKLTAVKPSPRRQSTVVTPRRRPSPPPPTPPSGSQESAFCLFGLVRSGDFLPVGMHVRWPFYTFLHVFLTGFLHVVFKAHPRRGRWPRVPFFMAESSSLVWVQVVLLFFRSRTFGLFPLLGSCE